MSDARVAPGIPTARAAPAARPRVTTVVAQGEHAPALAEFYRVTWNATATGESVSAARAAAARANVAEAGAMPPVFVVLEGERVIGHVATLPLRLWDGEEERGAYWLKGLSVLPEYRNGPVGFGVLKEAARQLPWSAGFVVAEPARRLFGALGYTDLGAVPNYVRVLDPAAVLRKVDVARLAGGSIPRALDVVAALARRPVPAAVAGALLGGALRMVAVTARLGSVAHRTAVDVPLPEAEDLDALWREARPSIRAGAVRDFTCLSRRYASSDYAFATVESSGRIRGLAIVKRPRPVGDPRLAGVGMATLSDLLVMPDDRAALHATLGAAERLARRLGAEALLCTASDPRLARALRRQAYLRLHGNVHLLVRDRSDRATMRPSTLADWWVMRGDAESDAAL